MDATQFDVKRLDHLGLVAGFCKEIGLADRINKKMPKESHRSNISNGQLLVAMILNGLGFVSRTLHMCVFRIIRTAKTVLFVNTG